MWKCRVKAAFIIKTLSLVWVAGVQVTECASKEHLNFQNRVKSVEKIRTKMNLSIFIGREIFPFVGKNA